MLRRVLLALLASAAAFSAPKSPVAPVKAAPVIAAAVVALAPAAALADVSFLEEVEGVALGIAPIAGAVALLAGGLISKLGPALEKGSRMKRTLALEYAAQKRFTKMDKLDIKA
jgi:hypothetical protein